MHDDPPISEAARDLAEHHYYAALDLVLEGHNERAVEEYKNALAADPNFTDALHGWSRALQDLETLRRGDRGFQANLRNRSGRHSGPHQPLNPVSKKRNGCGGRSRRRHSALRVEASLMKGGC